MPGDDRISRLLEVLKGELNQQELEPLVATLVRNLGLYRR